MALCRLSLMAQGRIGGIDVQTDPILMRPVEIQMQWGDSTKLKRTTGWQPRYALDPDVSGSAR